MPSLMPGVVRWMLHRRRDRIYTPPARKTSPRTWQHPSSPTAALQSQRRPDRRRLQPIQWRTKELGSYARARFADPDCAHRIAVGRASSRGQAGQELSRGRERDLNARAIRQIFGPHRRELRLHDRSIELGRAHGNGRLQRRRDQSERRQTRWAARPDRARQSLRRRRSRL